MKNREKSRKLWFLAAIAIFLFSTPKASYAVQEVECHANHDYLIISKAYAQEPGLLLAVISLKNKAVPKTCRFDAKKADFIIGKEGDPLWFEGLEGEFLILTRSTSSDGDLVIYNLKTRKPVLDVPANDYKIKNGQVVFWQRMRSATKADCPTFEDNEKNGLASTITAQKTFDIRNGLVRDTGKTQCDATQ